MASSAATATRPDAEPSRRAPQDHARWIVDVHTCVAMGGSEGEEWNRDDPQDEPLRSISASRRHSAA